MNCTLLRPDPSLKVTFLKRGDRQSLDDFKPISTPVIVSTGIVLKVCAG